MPGGVVDLTQETDDQIVKRHRDGREGFKTKFNEQLALWDQFKERSDTQIDPAAIDQIWNDYVQKRDADTDESKKKEKANKGSYFGRGRFTNDLNQINDFEKSDTVEKFKEMKDDLKKALVANKRIRGLVEETQGDCEQAEAMIKEYDDNAAVYEDQGEVYPDPYLLDQANDKGSEIKKKADLIKHKSTGKFTKSDLASKDVKDAAMVEQPKFITKSKTYKDAKKQRKSTIERMKEFKKGNDLVSQKTGKIREELSVGKKAMEGFNTEDTKVGDKEVLTRKKQAQYQEMTARAQSLSKQKKGVTELSEQIGTSGKYKVSTRKKQEFDQARQESTDFTGTSVTKATARMTQLKENRKKLDSDPSKKTEVRSLCMKLGTSLNTNLDKYLSTKTKIREEQKSDEGGGLISDIINDYADMESLVMSGISGANGKDQEDRESLLKLFNEVTQKKAQFDATRPAAQTSYKRIRPFLGSKPDRKMLMRLVKRVRLINHASTGNVKSDYDNWVSKMLKGMEHVSEFPQNAVQGTTKAILKKAKGSGEGYQNFEDEVDAGDTGLEEYGEIDDLIEGLDGAKKNMKKGALQKKAKAGDEDAQLKLDEIKAQEEKDEAEAEGNLGWNKKNAYAIATGIYGTAKSGFALLQQVVSMIKDISGGTDSREVFKMIMELADKAIDVFDSVTGFEGVFFKEMEIPILGTIKSGLTILHRITDFVRSTISRRKVGKKKTELKGKMKSDASFGLDDERTEEAAKKSGYDTRGRGIIWAPIKYAFGGSASTGAKAYAARERDEATYSRVFGSAYEMSAGTEEEKTERKKEVEKGGEDAKRDSITGSLHTRRRQLLQKKMAREGAVAPITEQEHIRRQEEDQEDALLSRIETEHEYDILNEATVRMKNKQNDDVYDIITESWSIISDFMKLSASPAAVAAAIGDIAMHVIDIGKSVTTYVAKKVRNNVGNNMYSDKNKGDRRSKMATNIYDRLSVVGESLNADGIYELDDEKPDEIVGDDANHLHELSLVLEKGLDAYISHILDCNTKDDMIENMSEAFSVDGN